MEVQYPGRSCVKPDMVGRRATYDFALSGEQNEVSAIVSNMFTQRRECGQTHLMAMVDVLGGRPRCVVASAEIRTCRGGSGQGDRPWVI